MAAGTASATIRMVSSASGSCRLMISNQGCLAARLIVRFMLLLVL